jgi:hypothetical protein
LQQKSPDINPGFSMSTPSRKYVISTGPWAKSKGSREIPHFVAFVLPRFVATKARVPHPSRPYRDGWECNPPPASSYRCRRPPDQHNSRISMEDYAIALVDELEKPHYERQRFTIGY